MIVKTLHLAVEAVRGIMFTAVPS